VEHSEINAQNSALTELRGLIEDLRGKNGCPWDKKQTPNSMVAYLLEEAYELADAVETNQAELICEEMGDVLFHIFFMARLFEEMESFNIDEVARGITDKMVRRHPHVFGNEKVDRCEDVIRNWHKIKLEEKKNTEPVSILDSIPLNLPALMRAYRICERAGKAGIDWEDRAALTKKLDRQFADVKSALNNPDSDHMDSRLGAFLFSLANAARFAKVHPETALGGSIKMFEKRFRKMEKRVADKGIDLQSLSPAEKKQMWQDLSNGSDSHSVGNNII
jgi:tetrapyrrole methylase family protein/MazG family protein